MHSCIVTKIQRLEEIDKRTAAEKRNGKRRQFTTGKSRAIMPRINGKTFLFDPEGKQNGKNQAHYRYDPGQPPGAYHYLYHAAAGGESVSAILQSGGFHRGGQLRWCGCPGGGGYLRQPGISVLFPQFRSGCGHRYFGRPVFRCPGHGENPRHHCKLNLYSALGWHGGQPVWLLRCQLAAAFAASAGGHFPHVPVLFAGDQPGHCGGGTV